VEYGAEDVGGVEYDAAYADDDGDDRETSMVSPSPCQAES